MPESVNSGFAGAEETFGAITLETGGLTLALNEFDSLVPQLRIVSSSIVGCGGIGLMSSSP